MCRPSDREANSISMESRPGRRLFAIALFCGRSEARPGRARGVNVSGILFISGGWVSTRNSHLVFRKSTRRRAPSPGQYATTLQERAELGTEDRNRLATRMAQMIHMPASAIAAANLRINTQGFLEQLVPGKVVGRIDTRVAAPRPDKPLVAGRDKACGRSRSSHGRFEHNQKFARARLPSQ
jgi:hypothetical protein